MNIQVQSNASKSCLAGFAGDRLKVRIAAAPEDGKANRELIAFFAHLLRCPKKALAIRSGHTSRLKTLAIPRIYEEALEKLIPKD